MELINYQSFNESQLRVLGKISTDKEIEKERKKMKEKEYEISIKTVKENILVVTASSKEEALKSAEDIVLAPDYEKTNNTKATRNYIVGELVENKPRFLKKNTEFVFLKK